MSRILVVDDDPDIRALVALTLRRAGHDVHTANDGEAALAAAEELRPDLVAMDWMMPRLTGVEVCEALRARPHLATMGIVLMSARSQDADRQRALAAGADDYLLKPFRSREVVKRVDAVLKRIQS